MFHSTTNNIQQRRNIRSSLSTSFPPKIGDFIRPTTTILPLNHRLHHDNGYFYGSSGEQQQEIKRRKKTLIIPFPWGTPVVVVVAVVITTGSLVLFFFVIMMRVHVVQGTNQDQLTFRNYGDGATKQHYSVATTWLWSFFPVPSAEQTQFSSSFPSASSMVRVLQGDTADLEIYDVVIAGSGVAGLSAALFAARAGLKVIVLGSSQGLLSQTKQLDNFPSFLGYNNDPATGPGWLQATTQQAKHFGAIFAPPGLLVSSIQWSRMQGATSTSNTLDHMHHYFFTLTTALHEYHARSVIVASGASPKTLNLPNERDLWGITLHNCAICDGHLYAGSDKHVLVVGGGDAALDAAILLARYAGKITLVHRRNEFTSVNNPVNLDLVNSISNIQILTPFVMEAWEVDPLDTSRLLGARLKDTHTGSTRELEIDGAFVMIGATPNTEWVKSVGVVLDDEGFIQLSMGNGDTSTYSKTQTSINGIFAAGEVTDRMYKQAITAAASGAEAAIDVERWLRQYHGVTFRLSAHDHKQSKVDPGSPNTVVTGKSHQKNNTSHSNIIGVEQRIQIDVTSSNENHQSQTADDCDLSQLDCIQIIVDKHPVVVFSKPWCPYCKKALEALALAGVTEPYVIDLSKYPNTQDIQSSLKQLTGRRTVPNVFVGGKSIGGGDETVFLHRSGKLVTILQNGGAFTSEKSQEQQEQQQDLVSATNRTNDDGKSCDLISEDCFQAIVQKYPVVMFSLSWCPECKRSLELLARIGVKPRIIDLDDYKPISENIRMHMLKMTGRRSVPNLFVGGEYIGGFQQTSELHKRGELIPKLKQVGVLA
jgi:thioredoxin reductase (NADPH)